jgi:hypothetical protein
MKYVFGFLAFLLAIFTILFIPSKQPPAPSPWEVSIMQDGNPMVFSIHLGKTTLAQAQDLLRDEAEIGVFSNTNNEKLSAEAYFNSLNLGGLSAKVVLNLNVEQEKLQLMVNHANEGRLQASGARKYTLNAEDNYHLQSTPINAITYIPTFVKLNEKVIKFRFGEPKRIEQLGAKTIWHYPKHGLTIEIAAGEKSILQYQTIK